MKRQNHYSTLHVDQCASCAEIKSAFRTLAQRFHPDVTTDRDGERKFKDVAEAYRTLRGHDSRVAYDHQIKNRCAENMALEMAAPNMGAFNWGLVLMQYFSLFWLQPGRDAD
ncbi:J domain-containing protein [Ferribacterium limneticum]|uniref:J domain-containing protein n=1 Tax=Ferribacterium limneticum TaxID=76259 RepID=UPI001CF91F21|nr:J domain-containing protein [Ferribacterium limneticum]UCV23369.1 J domain-containing protein [Ferribacterium limneticum]